MKIKKYISIIFGVMVGLFLFVNGAKFFSYNDDSYYLNFITGNTKDNEVSNYKTAIDHNTKLSGVTINSESDSIKLIEDDSKEQEAKCNNDLSSIEEDLKEYTNIYGINFCEISSDDAKSIADTIKDVYDKYPKIRNYITNVTLVNDGGKDSYIAAFKPSYTFATSNNNSGFPFVIKIQIYLNASYFLNDKYMDKVIKNAIDSKYFPKDTTKESLVAHELGHALTYILDIKYNNSVNTLMLKKEDFKLYSSTLKDYTSSSFSKKIVSDAYLNYKYKYGEISEEEFRKNISLYANSKETSGIVIYNETVAEAFHDYYLHGENAKKESIEIMNVLNKYL